MTVNTLYFWKDTNSFLLELYRVLRPGGVFVMAYVDKESMERLPFTAYGFHCYSKGDFMKIVSGSPFQLSSAVIKNEMVQSKMGTFTKRKYHLIRLIK